jgi:hypothetical protein
MADEAEPEADTPPPRRSVFSLFLAVLVLGGSAVGVFIYHTLQSKDKPALDASGFDLAQTTEQPRPVASASSSAPQQPQASMLGVKTGLPGMQFGARSGTYMSQAEADKAKDTFTELCRKHEAKVRDYATAWTRKSIALQRYGKEWMSYPDLKKLNDDYMRDRDPVAFMRGLAQSKNFGTMIKRYAGEPQIQQFAKDGMKQAPRDLFNGAMDLMSKESVIKSMVDNVLQALGLPPGLLGGGGGQVDSGKIMDSVLKGNPQMQQALQNNPELQKQVPSAAPK